MTGNPDRGAQDREKKSPDVSFHTPERPPKESCQSREASPEKKIKVSQLNKENVQEGSLKKRTILEELMQKPSKKKEARNQVGRGARAGTEKPKKSTGRPEKEKPRNNIMNVMQMWKERDKKAKEETGLGPGVGGLVGPFLLIGVTNLLLGRDVSVQTYPTLTP